LDNPAIARLESVVARLESVIPTQAAPKPPKANNPPPPPPTPKPVPPPLWLSGQLPAAQRGRGAGGYQRGPQKGGRGGQGPPGGHTSNRSAGPPAARGGTRSDPRGGHQSRWGRW